MPSGLLYSQIGYDSMYSVRVIARSDSSDFIPASATCRLASEGEETASTDFAKAVEQWGSFWWVAEFPAGLPQGKYTVEVVANGVRLLSGADLIVKAGVFWDSTVEIMSTEMLEIRACLAKYDCGWYDAGTDWQESNTQSAMVLGLCDLLEFSADKLSSSLTQRIYGQVVHGCDYLVQSQLKAKELGHPEGSLSHDILGHPNEILPADGLKAVVAWRRAARLLPDGFDSKRSAFNAAADQALLWLEGAQPMGDRGFCRRQRGLAPDAEIPADEWMTRDLLTMAWAAVETFRGARCEFKAKAVELARQVMARQISKEAAEAGSSLALYGHFREFDSAPHSEKAWSHSIYGGQFGADAGGAFPHYLIPLVEMIKLWPEHEDAAKWRECLVNFAEGYLIPACNANPFQLAPYGVCDEEGLIWFAGPWHGFNCVYAYTAVLALELAELLDKPELRVIANANLQWIAGLNAGITADAIQLGCVLYREDLASDVAVPVSMIHRIGNRTAGTWLATRGVICNGFATGEQFKFDTDPTRAADSPHSFTDEDWINHNAAWLSAMARLQR